MTGLTPLQSAQQALSQGEWEQARKGFEAALEQAETPEGLEGLSWAAFWLNDAGCLFDARQRAYQLYREAEDRLGAARMAIWLGSDYMEFRGEPAVANGWFQRAKRLLEGLEVSPEHGWLAHHQGYYALEFDNDLAAAGTAGRMAAETGSRLELVDLEMLGLALEGLAMVAQGQVEDGMRQLDEGAAAALGGEFKDVHSAIWAACYLISACERVSDYDRATQWCRQVEAFARRFQIQFVMGACRASYGGVLTSQGAWAEAESVLASAVEDLVQSRPQYTAEATVRLAELRRRQGRLDEARSLFEQVHFHPLALLGLAELAIDEAEPEGAAELIQRFLRRLPAEGRTQRASALRLLVRVYAMLGDHQRAGLALDELRSIAEVVATESLQASVAFSEAVAAVAGGTYEMARRRFEDALDLFERIGAPFEAASARLELAAVQAALGRDQAARRLARSALEAFSQIGASHGFRRAELLVRQLTKGGEDGRQEVSPLTRREVEVLRLVARGFSTREIAGELVISDHTVHRHVANILTKLDCPTRAAAAAFAASRDLI